MKQCQPGSLCPPKRFPNVSCSSDFIETRFGDPSTFQEMEANVAAEMLQCFTKQLMSPMRHHHFVCRTRSMPLPGPLCSRSQPSLLHALARPVYSPVKQLHSYHLHLFYRSRSMLIWWT